MSQANIWVIGRREPDVAGTFAEVLEEAIPSAKIENKSLKEFVQACGSGLQPDLVVITNWNIIDGLTDDHIHGRNVGLTADTLFHVQPDLRFLILVDKVTRQAAESLAEKYENVFVADKLDSITAFITSVVCAL